MEVSLCEDQHDQMCNIVEKVTQLGAEELESSLEESEQLFEQYGKLILKT